MNCPECNSPITVFVPEKSISNSGIYCENCKKFFAFPLVIRKIRQCECGTDFSYIMQKRQLYCEQCYSTFREELEPFFSYGELDEIYLPETSMFRKFYYHYFTQKKYSLAKARIEIIQDAFRYPCSLRSESLVWNINDVPLRIKNGDFSIRIRYSRNFSLFPYQLNKESIMRLSEIMLGSSSFVLSLLKKNYNFYELNQQQWETSLYSMNIIKEEWELYQDMEYKDDYLNVKWLLLPFPDGKMGIFRLYIGDEDHFRCDCTLFFRFDLYSRKAKDKTHVSEAILKQEMVSSILYVYQIFQFLDLLFVWQFSPELGFLTACPTNAGSGIRLYVRFRFSPDQKTKILNFLQRNIVFKRLKNYTIRGEEGENSEIRKAMIIGWDLPYLDLKKFGSDLEKKLIIWFYEILSITKINKI